MKLLVFTNNPSRPSFRQRIEIYLQTLCCNGIDCKVAKLPSGELARLKLFKQAANFDCVVLQKKCLNLLDALWLRKYSKKIIYDFDDAIMYSPNRPATDKTSHFRLFRRTAKLADMVITGNPYLAEHAKRFNNNVHILPTGLDTKAYDLSIKPKDDGKIRLVWIGSKSTLKYLTEIKPALEEVGKKYPNVVLRIICDDFFDLENMEVEKCHWSLENQVKYLATADIGLAPLPNNRFTMGKCGFKILQYQAAHLPVVTSPVGINAEYVTEGMTGYWASDNNQWVDRISELIENAELRKQMANVSQRHVEKFDIRVTSTKLCEILTEFIEKTEPVAISVTPSVTTEPKVSICTSTYNRKDYLKETIDSILAQTYKDYEIVIMDDGSTDGTKEFVESLNCPIRYFWQRNAGDSVAKNKLIELAKGKYITFIDSDDLLLPDSIENLVKTIESEEETIIAYGPYYRIDENSKIYGRCKRKLYNGKITKYLFQTILVHNCGTMYPANILKEYKGYDCTLPVCYDYDLNLRISLNYKFRTTFKPVFKRRRHLNNLSVPSFKNCLTEFKVLERFYYEKGGKKVIPEKIAMKVFSKEGRRTGRCAIKEGLHDQACQLLKQSLRQYPNLKSLISWIRAMIVKRLAS